MKLTRRTDYALRVLMYLAANPEESHTILELSERYNISKNHLMKVANELSTHGLISAQRGRGGGLRLGQPVDNIKIGDVVLLMEPSLDVIDCNAYGGCILLPSCKLKKALNEAALSFIEKLNSYTLANLIGDKKTLQRLLD